MNMYFNVNLSKYYNHIIYENKLIESNDKMDKRTIYGLPHNNNINIIDKKELCKTIFGIRFQFAEEGCIFDNLMCDCQTIEIFLKSISEIYLLGFSEMGTVLDEIVLHTSDEKKVVVPFVFKTFHSDSFRGIDNDGINSRCQLAFFANGNDGQKHGVYFWKIDLKKTYNIDYMVLPPNCSMHIMAITVKYGLVHKK